MTEEVPGAEDGNADDRTIEYFLTLTLDRGDVASLSVAQLMKAHAAVMKHTAARIEEDLPNCTDDLINTSASGWWTGTVIFEEDIINYRWSAVV